MTLFFALTSLVLGQPMLQWQTRTACVDDKKKVLSRLKRRLDNVAYRALPWEESDDEGEWSFGENFERIYLGDDLYDEVNLVITGTHI